MTRRSRLLARGHSWRRHDEPLGPRQEPLEPEYTPSGETHPCPRCELLTAGDLCAICAAELAGYVGLRTYADAVA